MQMNASNALLFLVDTLFTLYIVAVLLRVLLQMSYTDYQNPISQFVWQVTQLPVALLARIIPRWRYVDIPAIVFALLLCFLNIQIDLALYALDITAPIGLVLLWTVLKLLVVLCNLYIFTILIQVVFSWISPGTHTPATAVLWSINEPLLRPVRGVIPAISGLDISPVIIIIVLQVLSRLLPLPGLFR